MLKLTALVPLLPLIGFLLLVAGQGRWSRRGVAIIGVGSVATSAILAFAAGISFLLAPPSGHVFTVGLWQWLAVDGLHVRTGFYLDPLAVVMMLVVTGVGFLIHLYSAEYMAEDEGYARFFAYMNLFVAAMLVLVLADNLLFLYLGWEGVGLCSYLLIGFWYRDPENGAAARKAFVVTRIGDTAFAIGLLLLFTQLGTFDIQPLMQEAVAQWPRGTALPTVAALLLLAGAVGKSAQLPLQTWLPDAMAGPTPVSALIHAATMVTAGVYLIARTHLLFSLAPGVLYLVGWIGAATLLLAAFAALVQNDIKRILAYSTISQIGYMFLALGMSAWPAAIFHFMTHAFFKALLFLSAGAVTMSLGHERNVLRMGGVWSELPAVAWCFFAGAASLAALPLVTAGFYSKDMILWAAWSAPHGGPGFWAAGLLGAFLTALYIFRAVFLVFFGRAKTPVSERPGARIMVPMGVLAVLALIAGFIQLPPGLGDIPLLSGFLAGSFGRYPESYSWQESVLQLVSALTVLVGVYVAWRRYRAGTAEDTGGELGPWARLWRRGWGFDWLYGRLLVRPWYWLTTHTAREWVDLPYAGIAALSRAGYRQLSLTQGGRVRMYLIGVALGSVFVVGVSLWV